MRHGFLTVRPACLRAGPFFPQGVRGAARLAVLPLPGLLVDAFSAVLEVLESRFGDWGVPADETGDLAAFALSMVEGALLLARVRRDVSVLRVVGRQLARRDWSATAC